MSLLSELRDAPASDYQGENPWGLVSRMVPLLVPNAEIREIRLVRGQVAVRGSAPRRAQRRYFVAVLHNLDDSVAAARESILRVPERPHGQEVRLAQLGLARYRDDAEGNYFAAPFLAWLPPLPGAMVAWMAGVLLAADGETPNPA